MKIRLNFILLFSFTILFVSCKEEYFPPTVGIDQKYVVEGYVEAGDNPLPAYVILTTSFPFYGTFDTETFDSSFVHGADVKVSDGSIEVTLQEVCLADLEPEIRKEIATRFGLNGDSLEVNFCAYIDLFNQLQPAIGKQYDLVIHTGNDLITSTTTIPGHVPFQNPHFEPPPGQPNDTLAQLKGSISDPPGVHNYYRYLSATNGGQLKTSIQSINDDLVFDGKTFEFQLLNPETDMGNDDPDEFGLYFVGDTVTIKWLNMDKAHFDFWNTLEFAKANQGPFSSYTRIATNINGGLGIWGGFSVSYYTLPVQY